MGATAEQGIAEIDKVLPNPPGGFILGPSHRVQVEAILGMLQSEDAFAGCPIAAFTSIQVAVRKLHGYVNEWKLTAGTKQQVLLGKPSFSPEALVDLRAGLAAGLGKTPRQRELGARLLSFILALEAADDEAKFDRYQERVGDWIAKRVSRAEAIKFFEANRSRNVTGAAEEVAEHLNAMREEALGYPDAFPEPPQTRSLLRFFPRLWARVRMPPWLKGGALVVALGTVVLVLTNVDTIVTRVQQAHERVFRYPVSVIPVAQRESNVGYVVQVRVSSTNGSTVWIPVRSIHVELALDDEVLAGMPADKREKLVHGESARVFDEPLLLEAAIAGRSSTSTAPSMAFTPEARDLYLLVTVAGPGGTNPSRRFLLGKVYRSLRVTVRKRLYDAEYLDVPIRHVPIIAGNDKTRVIEE